MVSEDRLATFDDNVDGLLDELGKSLGQHVGEWMTRQLANGYAFGEVSNAAGTALLGCAAVHLSESLALPDESPDKLRTALVEAWWRPITEMGQARLQRIRCESEDKL